MSTSYRTTIGVATMAVALGCAGPEGRPCEELSGAEALNRIPIGVGVHDLSAEVAATQQERDDAWVGRVCGTEALVWVPEVVEPPSVSLCGVEIAVDLAFVRQSEVVATELSRPSCEGPCESCPHYGATGPAADAVLWLPAGQVELTVGQFVEGLEAAPLPSP